MAIERMDKHKEQTLVRWSDYTTIMNECQLEKGGWCEMIKKAIQYFPLLISIIALIVAYTRE